MTLKTLIDRIGKLAIDEKIINFSAAGNDIYSLNGMNIDGYPVLFTCPAGTHTVRDNTTTYSLTLFYIDRLLEDGSNDIDIYSVSIEQLKNLILKIDNIIGVLGVEEVYTITNFETDPGKMDDFCGGAYATIKVKTSNILCPE